MSGTALIAAQNNPETAPEQKPLGRPFTKGVSGNPNGRPRIYPDIKLLAKQHSKDAFLKLVFWSQSDNPKASVAASKEILDRAWGRPLALPDMPPGGSVSITVAFVNPP